MSARMGLKEVQGVEEVREKTGSVGAFFDVDGTLMALPSLERRLFRMLRFRREIRTRNYFFWLREALRLARSGVGASLQANKMYLRGVQSFEERGWEDEELSPQYKDGHQALRQAPASTRRNPRLPVPVFFEEAIERVAWHGKQGHAIVLVSGTLEPLAQAAARTMEGELAARGIFLSIRVRATRLKEVDGRWTGKILGEAMVGEAKARAVFGIAAKLKLDLAQSYAYGDSAGDRWLMSAMGRPVAVNPSKELARIARTFGWPMLNWAEKESLTQRRGVRRGKGESVETLGRAQETGKAHAKVGSLG